MAFVPAEKRERIIASAPNLTARERLRSIAQIAPDLVAQSENALKEQFKAADSKTVREAEYARERIEQVVNAVKTWRDRQR